MAIEWRFGMSIDGGRIDDDHKRLISIINSFEQPHMTKWDLAVVLEDLRQYTRRHFAREERIQRQINYPHVDKHQQGHLYLMERLDKIVSNFANARPDDFTVAVQQTQGLLAEWMLDHVLKVDLAMRPYV